MDARGACVHNKKYMHMYMVYTDIMLQLPSRGLHTINLGQNQVPDIIPKLCDQSTIKR